MFPHFVIVVDRVDIVGIFGKQGLVEGLPLGNLLNKVGNDLMIFILPWFLSEPVGRLITIDAPVVVEILLHLLHLFARRFFSIFLHARVDSGVDFQTA